MANDTTALERKVLAHEQILQVLIGHLAETEPKFLERLKAVFTHHHILGSNEKNCVKQRSMRKNSFMKLRRCKSIKQRVDVLRLMII